MKVYRFVGTRPFSNQRSRMRCDICKKSPANEPCQKRSTTLSSLQKSPAQRALPKEMYCVMTFAKEPCPKRSATEIPIKGALYY